MNKTEEQLEEEKTFKISCEECSRITDGLDSLNDEHLGSVLNAVLIEIFQRDLSVEFVEGSLSQMANWALGK